MNTPIPILNIYYMLCYAWNQLEEAGRVRVGTSDYRQYVDLFARVLSNGCHYLLKRGLDRDYQWICNELAGIRGKPGFSEAIRSNRLHLGRIFCEYDELSNDTLHNRIIKAVIYRVLQVKSLDSALRTALRDIYSRLRKVSDIRLSSRHFKQVRLHRNNLFYRFVLNVAWMLYSNTVPDESTGKYEFVDFIRNERKMAGVFENFVRNFYAREMKGKYCVKSEILAWDVAEETAAARDLLPQMRTDISLASDERKIIIDTKYYAEALQKYYDRVKLISPNLYQLFAYVKNSEIKGGASARCEGILLYPTVGQELDVEWKTGEHKMAVKTVNLNEDWRHIDKRLKEIVA